MYFAIFLQRTVTKDFDQVVGFVFGSLLYTTEASSVQANLTPSGAETNDKEDGPAKLSSDTKSVDAQPSKKPSKVKGRSAAPTERPQSHTEMEGWQLVIFWFLSTKSFKQFITGKANYKIWFSIRLQAHSTEFMSSLTLQVCKTHLCLLLLMISKKQIHCNCERTSEVRLFKWPFSSTLHIHALFMPVTVSHRHSPQIQAAQTFHFEFSITEVLQVENVALQKYR